MCEILQQTAPEFWSNLWKSSLSSVNFLDCNSLLENNLVLKHVVGSRVAFWDHSIEQDMPTQVSMPSPRFRSWLTFVPSSSPGADSRDLPLKVPGSSLLALPRRERLDRDPTERNTKTALMGAGTAGSQTEPDQGESSSPKHPSGCRNLQTLPYLTKGLSNL